MNNFVEELEKLKKERRDLAFCRSAIESKLDKQAFGGGDLTQDEINKLNEESDRLEEEIEKIDNQISEIMKKMNNRGRR